MEETIKHYCITTIDNPFSPVTQFNDWYTFDCTHGYFTCQRLASIAFTSEQLTDAENAKILSDAQDELIKTGAIDKEGNFVEYKKVLV